jgi:hypothetical protein
VYYTRIFLEGLRNIIENVSGLRSELETPRIRNKSAIYSTVTFSKSIKYEAIWLDNNG